MLYVMYASLSTLLAAQETICFTSTL